MEDIRKFLIKTCNEMNRIAIKDCYFDFGIEESCCWYHSVWQYLRLLDCVSSPQWNERFYVGNFERLSNEKRNRVLISGTADYSMLHILINTLYERNICAEIYIVDKCKTPVEICRRYMSMLNEDMRCYAKKNIRIKYEQTNIFTFNERDFDLICSDAFLTRFSKNDARSVLEEWNSKLSENGIVVTTVREHAHSESDDIISYTQKIKKFEEKVLRKYDEFEGDFPISRDEILFLANRYIVEMRSNNLGEMENIEKLFRDSELLISEIERCKTPGEIEFTNYLCIVARKMRRVQSVESVDR